MSIRTVADSFYWERKTAPLLGRFLQVELQSTQPGLLISPAYLAILKLKILQFRFQRAKVLMEQKHIGKVEAVCELVLWCNTQGRG